MKLKKVQISDLGEIITGNTPPKANSEYYDNHTIFVKPTDINTNEKYTYVTEESYSELAYKKYIKSLIPKGSTCVVTIGSIGKKITKAHCDLFINQAMNAVVPNKNYDEDFIFYLLKFNLGKVKTLDSGTASGRENVSKSAFSKINLSVPSLIVQKKIGKLLSNYDNLIENNNKRIKLLENMAEELYKEWFVRLRFPNYQNTKIEDGIPQGWEKKKIESICNVGRGSSPRPITDSKYFENGDIPWLKIADATASFIYIYKTKEYVNEYGASFSRKLPKNSLIIAASGTLGFPMFLATECCIHDGWMYFIDLDKSLRIYFYYSLIYLKEYFNNQSYGAAIQNINTNIVKKSTVTIPKKEILDNFNEIVIPIFDEIQLLQQKNQTLKQTRDLLLSRLLSGKLDIEKLDIN